jgi:hypothetical protein
MGAENDFGTVNLLLHVATVNHDSLMEKAV